MNYAVGFIFSPNLEHVILIEKKRPEWQAGLLNGVGGKQEPNERRARDTMARECLEETGLEIVADEWTMFAELIEPKSHTRVVFFFTISDQYNQARSTTDERVGAYLTCDLRSRPTIPNLQWLIPLAMDWDRQCAHSVMIMGKEKK